MLLDSNTEKVINLALMIDDLKGIDKLKCPVLLYWKLDKFVNFINFIFILRMFNKIFVKNLNSKKVALDFLINIM